MDLTRQAWDARRMQWLILAEHAAAGAALMLVGTSLVLAGLGSIPGQVRSVSGFRDWALVYLRVFRRVVVGLCVVGAGAGLVAQVPWLVAASLCVGIGEWLESSYYLGVLRWSRGRAGVRGAHLSNSQGFEVPSSRSREF
jgi:hypothetical protein